MTETTNASKPCVRVGVSVIVSHPHSSSSSTVLLGKRLGSHGAGTWQFPGGHLEFGEEPGACAARECLEETGLAVGRARLVALTNDVFKAEGKHYVTLFVKCELADADADADTGADADADGAAQGGGQPPTPKVMEPDKCELWAWKTWDEIRAMAAAAAPAVAPATAAAATATAAAAARRDRLFLPVANLLLKHERPEEL